MSNVTPFPTSEERAWRSVVDGMTEALQIVGHGPEAIAYAFARFRPFWLSLREDETLVAYAADLRPVVDELAAKSNRLVSRTFIVALIAFAECYDMGARV